MSDVSPDTAAAEETPFGGAVRLVLDLDEPTFDEVHKVFGDASAATSSRRLAERVTEATNLPLSDARSIVSAVAAMSTAAMDSSPGSRSGEERLARTVVRHELGDLESEQGPVAVERFVLLMRSEGLRLMSKARRLNYAHDRVYQSGEVFSDLRPIFGGDNEESPSGFLIWHTLRLRFSNGLNPADEFSVIEFALDGRDLELLRDQVDRAIVKHKALRTKLGEFSAVHFPMGELKDKSDD